VTREEAAVIITTAPLASVIKDHIICTLALEHGNICHTAKLLGISRWALRRMMKKYGIAGEGKK